MGALLQDKGWKHHPAVDMWRGNEWALLQYQKAIVKEWTDRGYKDTCLQKTSDLYQLYATVENEQDFPEWYGDPDVLRSHQSNLIRKNPEYYAPQFPDIPGDLPYVWPISKPLEIGPHVTRVDDNLVIEHAELMFKNFAGNEREYNSAGDRNFCVRLSPELAESMRNDGWNVKQLRLRAEDEEEGKGPQSYLQVTVNYSKGRPPRVVLLSKANGRVDLGADEVEMLDYADLANVDLTINPYNWGPINGNSGVKAYLKTAYITLNEDPIELKYALMKQEDDQYPTSSSTVSDD